MRALWLVLTFAACGSTEHGTFDPHPGTPPDNPPDMPPGMPPTARAFTVSHDLRGTIGYCSNVEATGPTIDECTTKTGRFAADLVPNALVFNNDNRTATCRIGHVPEVDSMPFIACPIAVAGEVTLPITPTTGAHDGSYRADVLYTDVDNATKSYSTSFYVHRSIDGAASCPTDPTTYPSDARFFAEAAKEFTVPDPSSMTILPTWIDRFSFKGVIPHTIPFGGSDVAHAPFYQLHFKGVRLGQYRKLGKVDASLNATTVNLGSTNEFDVPIWSLRHHIAFNGDRTLVVVRRAYESRMAQRLGKTGATPREPCAMRIRFGAMGHRVKLDCDALVLNSAGEGFCMTVGEDDEGATVVGQGVFSINMVAKLMRGSAANTPSSGDPSLWGSKIFELVDASSPDDEFERDDTVVLRP